MKYKLEKEGGLFIEDINVNEIERLSIMVGAFEITDAQAPQMCNKILYDINKKILEFETLKQFSKWCHTSVRYIKPQGRARDISNFLFDDVIPRLCDQQDRTQKYQVEEYINFLTKLKKNELLIETEQHKKFRVTFFEQGILLNREFEIGK